MKAITNLVKLFFCLVLFCGVSISSYAEELASATLTVQQSFVDLDGAPYTSEAEVVYRLSAGAQDSPMPAGSEDGQYSFSIKGNTTNSTAPILFKHAGVFSYVLQAAIPESFPYQWSPQVFNIQIYVSNDGSSLMVIHNQDQVKVAAMSAVYVSPTRRPSNNGNDSENSNSGNRENAGDTQTLEDPSVPREIPDISDNLLSVGKQISVLGLALSNLSDLAKTGDSSHTTIWVIVCVLSLIGLIILYVKKRK